MLTTRWFAAAIALGVLAAACSDDQPATQPETQPTVAVTVPADSSWEQVVPGGDCNCSDGSEFSFWVHQGDPEKVVFFLQGGGACFNATTCSPTSILFKQTTGAEDNPASGGGVFDLADPRNPLADYSFVFVPYCTGDVHLGDATTEYAPDLTVQHKGYVNGTAALDHLVATFPDAKQIVVAGESAGSIPTPLYAGLLGDRLPDARVAVLADGSGAYPDVATLNADYGARWGVQNALPDWAVEGDATSPEWSIPGLFVQAGLHNPAIEFARHDYASDRVQLIFLGLAGVPVDDLLTLIDDNEVQIEAAGVELDSFIAPGGRHTVLGDSRFYTDEVDGVLLLDWVTALVRGEPVDDVHCTVCE